MLDEPGCLLPASLPGVQDACVGALQCICMAEEGAARGRELVTS